MSALEDPSALVVDSKVVHAPESSAMSAHVQRHRLAQLTKLDPHQDARSIVRLVQCKLCSLPLRQPYTLPCGRSLCRACLPETHTRDKISYPMTPDRLEGFTCPFDECGREHTLGDCSQDRTLTKAVERVGIEMARYRPFTSDTPTLVIERPRWKDGVDSAEEKDEPRSRILSGGRLMATYTMADLGELRYDADVSYQTMSESNDTYEHLDVAMFQHLKEAMEAEMYCQVCYNLMLDPFTTACGHTFCRSCVLRVLDHSNLCPVCRSVLHLHPGRVTEPSNERLNALLNWLCPELVLARTEAHLEDVRVQQENSVPLFVVTLAYPSMPTFLHVFEPRYRLMMRRAIESGERKFGMVAYNARNEPQGELGTTPFRQYGTLLHIVNMQLLPDGRSLVESVGVSRFRVKSHSMLDGYVVGNVERVDDIPLAEEEAIEAREVSVTPSPNDPLAQLNAMSTKDLMQISLDFLDVVRRRSATWLEQVTMSSYGPPPQDPATFPYWFASVIPVNEEQKYRLLMATSVRDRLKMTACWVKGIQNHRWCSSGPCNIL